MWTLIKPVYVVVKCNFSKIISLQLKEMQDSRRKEYRRGIKIIDRRGIIAQIESAMYRDRDLKGDTSIWNNTFLCSKM